MVSPSATAGVGQSPLLSVQLPPTQERAHGNVIPGMPSLSLPTGGVLSTRPFPRARGGGGGRLSAEMSGLQCARQRCPPGWGHLTKRKKSYAIRESCQLDVYGLADRPSDRKSQVRPY